MDNGNYGGAFVLTDEKGTEIGKNHIAITTIDKPTKPTIEDFKNALKSQPPIGTHKNSLKFFFGK